MDVSVVPLSPDLLLLRLSSMNFKTSNEAVAMNKATSVPSFRAEESIGGFAKTPMKGSDCSFRTDIRNRICKGERHKVLPVEFR
jgi:hypothetical protein